MIVKAVVVTVMLVSWMIAMALILYGWTIAKAAVAIFMLVGWTIAEAVMLEG